MSHFEIIKKTLMYVCKWQQTTLSAYQPHLSVMLAAPIIFKRIFLHINFWLLHWHELCVCEMIFPEPTHYTQKGSPPQRVHLSGKIHELFPNLNILAVKWTGTAKFRQNSYPFLNIIMFVFGKLHTFVLKQHSKLTNDSIG